MQGYITVIPPGIRKKNCNCNQIIRGLQERTAPVVTLQ